MPSCSRRGPGCRWRRRCRRTDAVGASQVALQTGAGHVGVAAIAATGIVDLVVGVIIFVWLIRLSEPRANGKAKKLALTAAMRKLLVILNAMLRDGTPWQAA